MQIPHPPMPETNSMGEVKVGIIGIGHIGSAHAKRIFSGDIKGLSLAAVCDIDPSRREYAERELKDTAVYDKWRELIKSGLCEAVIIATPHKLHSQIAIEALNAGLHVLTEKPQDITVTMAKRANEAAKKSGCVYGIMFNQRTDPLFIRLRELVKSGGLGEMKSLSWIITNWYRTQYYYDEGSWRATWSGEGGGVLMNQAVHNLDIMQWIFGMPKRLTAFCDTARYHDIEVEDAATIIASYENGATAAFITSTGECPGTNRLEVCGTLGKAVVENGALKLWKLSRDEREIRVNEKAASPQIELEYSEYVPEKNSAAPTAHAGVLQAFADCILTGSPLIADGSEGINQLMLTNAAYLSQWQGNIPVELPINGELYDRLFAERAAASKEKTVSGKEINGSYSERWSVKW